MCTRVPHQYRRRTTDEALDLAKAAFRAAVADNLTPAEIEELRARLKLSVSKAPYLKSLQLR